MKKTKNISVTLGALWAFMMIGIFANAQESKTDTVVIKTSAVCDMCQERIEKAVKFVKGTRSYEFNADTKELTVIFRPDKTSADELRKAISAAGYDADDVKADEKAYAKLPHCCQKDGHHED
ncbi:MAG: cation transporter [Flavobacteriales bacterium]|nr:cation transporter [Flavobacteriales bacterium]